MAFAWERPIVVERRVQTDQGAIQVQRGEATPREIVFDPFNYRTEDVINALCISARELILTVEAQARSAELARQLRVAMVAPPESSKVRG